MVQRARGYINEAVLVALVERIHQFKDLGLVAVGRGAAVVPIHNLRESVIVRSSARVI